jgi:heme exporter protein C
MASTMLTAMLIMTFAFWAYAFAVVFTRARAIVLERDQHARWAGQVAPPSVPRASGATT